MSCFKKRARNGWKWSMALRVCAPSGQLPSACSHWYAGSGRLKTSRIGFAMSRSMKTARRCAVATFPKSWQRYATPQLVYLDTQAIRTLRRRAVGWLPSRYKRWLSSGLNWKTKWPWSPPELLDADDFLASYGEPLAHTLNLDTWESGPDLASIFDRLDQEVRQALTQEDE